MPAARNTKTALAKRASGVLVQAKKRPSDGNGPSELVRTAVDLMVFEAVDRAEAAKRVGLSASYLKDKLNDRKTLAYMGEQMEVLRTSARPRALHRIIALSEKSASEKVGLDAAIYLDGQGKGSGGTTVNVAVKVETPGYVLDLREPDPASQQIGHLAQDGRKPLIEHDDVDD